MPIYIDHFQIGISIADFDHLFIGELQRLIGALKLEHFHTFETFDSVQRERTIDAN